MYLLANYCEIIFIRSTSNFEFFFMGRAIHEFKIPTKYVVTLVIWRIIRNRRIQVSIVTKPQKFMPTKLNDFTVAA